MVLWAVTEPTPICLRYSIISPTSLSYIFLHVVSVVGNPYLSSTDFLRSRGLLVFQRTVSFDWWPYIPVRGTSVLSLTYRSDLCGYNLTLTYPQNGLFKTLDGPISSLFEASFLFLRGSARRVIFSKRDMVNEVKKRAIEQPGGIRKREANRQQWKRDLSQRPNGTIDPYYGCAIYDEMVDYALNFSLPWSGSRLIH